MGYRAEKEKTERKRKILKRILLGVLLLCIAGIAIFSAIVPPASWKYHVNLPKISRRQKGEMRIHFINVGQGDSTLIELPDGKIMLIDGGDSRDSTEKKILRRLNALGINTIDYLIVTHADLDHCGGLNEVVKYKKIRNAYLPFIKLDESSEYARLYKSLTESDCNWAYSSSKLTNITSMSEAYPFKAAFLYPHSDDVNGSIASGELPSEGADNDYSAVVYLEYAGTRALFTGDAPREIEQEIIDSDKLGLHDKIGVSLKDLDLFKVAHHGSKDANGWDFLNYISPRTAVISCGKDNAYGNPSETVLGRLREVGADIYRTDVHGTVLVTVSPKGKYTVKA